MGELIATINLGVLSMFKNASLNVGLLFMGGEV